jgi:hypothetical protein
LIRILKYLSKKGEAAPTNNTHTLKTSKQKSLCKKIKDMKIKTEILQLNNIID